MKHVTLQVFLSLQDRQEYYSCCMCFLFISLELGFQHICAQPVTLGVLCSPHIHSIDLLFSNHTAPPLQSKTCSGQPPDSNRLHTVMSNEVWEGTEVNNISCLHSKHFWILFTTHVPLAIFKYLSKCLLDFTVHLLRCLFTSTSGIYSSVGIGIF